MAGSVGASRQHNGLHKPDAELYEVLEYRKILKIRDEVIAGSHPRLKISANVQNNTKSRVLPAPDTPKLTNGALAASQAPHAQSHGYKSSAPITTAQTAPLSGKSAIPRQTALSTTTSSGLDPIFLTKSEDLIKAEMRLKRQRIERKLEEQVQQRKSGIRQRISEQEALPEFDVSDVLFQAQQLVKPIATNESNGANGIASSSDSFDDHTFYSSQINDSATDEVEEQTRRRATKPCKYFFEGTCKKGNACTFSHDPAFKQQLQNIAPLTVEADNFNVSNQPHLRPSTRLQNEIANEGSHRRLSMENEGDFEGDDHLYGSAQDQTLGVRRRRPYHGGRDSGDAVNETVYSPREFLTQNSKLNNNRNHQYENYMELEHSHQDFDSTTGRLPPGSNSKRNGRISPATRDVRVVRNHITSPMAPQPARVSPLAVAKIPRLDQIRRGEQDSHSPRSGRRPSSAQPSPIALSQLSQPANSRKRRREPDFADSTRNVTARRDYDSPEPYIKDEPISPPPVSNYPTSQIQRYEQVGGLPVIIDSTPPQSRERVIYRRRHADPQSADLLGTRGVSSPVGPQVISRPGRQYEINDDPNVRHVLSARQSRRIISPQPDFAQYSTPQSGPPRAVSRSYVIQPEFDIQDQYRASMQPQAKSFNRGMPRVDRSLSPEIRRVEYSPAGRASMAMAPPPRRIVVDQYGNKYYEAPLPAEQKTPVVPLSRHINDIVNPFENVPLRRASVQPRPARSYDDRSYVSRLTSPEPVSPRYIEYIPATDSARKTDRHQVYEPRQEGFRDREEVVRVIEYPPGRPKHYEDLEESRQAPVRMSSVRPSVPQYEMSRKHFPRMQTVQPEHERFVEVGNRHESTAPVIRQISVRPDETYERAPTYITMQAPRYQYLSDEQESGFVRGHPQDDVMLDGPRGGDRRPLQRL